MEKTYSKSQVQIILQKVFLDGKISTTELYLKYLNPLIEQANEEFEYINYKYENGFLTSPEWSASQSKLATLSKVADMMKETLFLLNKKKNELNNK